MFSFFKDRDPDAKKRTYAWILLLGALAGVALLFWGNREEAPQAADGVPYDLAQDEILIYQNYMEEKVKALCASVDGVGDVTVVVSLEGDFTSVYATEYHDGNESYVIVGSGSSAKPLLLSRETPQIAGVGIVCKGGADPSIRHELTVLISAAFHISSNRIYITAA